MVNIIERKRLKFEDDYIYFNRNMIMDEHPEHIYKSLLEYFKKDDLHSYPDMWKPYKVLSNFLRVSQDKLLITGGVEGAFKQVFETLVDKGDSVGILTPTCAMYHVYAEVYGIDVKSLKYNKKCKTSRGIDNNRKQLIKYINLCHDYGTENLWNSWCSMIADKYPKDFIDGNHVSELHYTYLTGECDE